MIPKRPLRIAIAIARLNVGGPATHVIELAAGLPRDRFAVRLFAGREGRGETGMHYLADEKGVQSESVPALSPHLGPADLIAFFQLLRIFRAWKPDVVHTHTAKAGAVGRAAARCAGVPVIVHTFHGHVLRGYFPRPLEGFFRGVERSLTRITDRIVTLSPALKADLVEIGIAGPEKIEVVPLGMDLAALLECDSRRGELRAELGFGTGEPIVGIVGRLVPIKNHRLFLEAARSMVNSGSSARFVIVGDGELREVLGNLAAEMGIADRIRFLGWRKDMVPVYAGLDLLALSSDNEGTPVALIEGMAAGVPVVATAVGGVPDVVRDGTTGRLVPPGDPEAMRRAWRSAFEEKETTKRMSTVARREVEERFGCERMLSAMAALYGELTDLKTGATRPR
ncbi:MAG: glycosyltransferase [Anaerolineales bacterium]|nr:glycosyltransferase [Anaerolineales bacterium]